MYINFLARLVISSDIAALHLLSFPHQQSGQTFAVGIVVFQIFSWKRLPKYQRDTVKALVASERFMVSSIF